MFYGSRNSSQGYHISKIIRKVITWTKHASNDWIIETNLNFDDIIYVNIFNTCGYLTNVAMCEPWI